MEFAFPRVVCRAGDLKAATWNPRLETLSYGSALSRQHCFMGLRTQDAGLKRGGESERFDHDPPNIIWSQENFAV